MKNAPRLSSLFDSPSLPPNVIHLPQTPPATKIKAKLGGNAAAGFDFSAGCTPVVLKGAHCPRGRLGGVFSTGAGGTAPTAAATAAAATPGVRAALEAILQGRSGSAPQARGAQPREGGVGGGDSGDANGHGDEEEEEEGEGGERVSKVAKLEGEIERLRSENLRWQQVCVAPIMFSLVLLVPCRLPFLAFFFYLEDTFCSHETANSSTPRVAVFEK